MSRHREVDSKSNEITAVPELRDTRHLDAMGRQKDDTLPEPCITNGRLGDAMGDILGYARVSTGDQDVAGQTLRLTGAGASKVFSLNPAVG